ncbi:hypothetical protein M4V62_27525 [Streptomyces durmitorensis]|uniref:Tat pathway signal sequence domain protein n=1 Tax=Streptomyces durmitorensis TaxID=319947 RepID=A0ABY4PZF4_9ACTN|nr:hypothetical protein [Streptomyces durmitorensis]UQT58525.1 hypothetical protein M4V62_27525 [Streptomyces durmitorensis]
MAKDEYEYDPSYDHDALMLALTDEPLPEDSGRDPELVTEHAEALADVALLREHIGLVGRALAAPERAAPRPVVAVRPAGLRRRRFTAALGVAAATAAASLVGGLAWLAMESGGGMTESSDSDAAKGVAPGDEKENGGGAAEDLSPEGYVACARLIVEGSVRRVEPIPGGVQDRIVLDVSRYYKPSKGEKQITFVMNVDVDPRLRPGDRTLIGIAKGEATPDIWSTGAKDIAKDREWIERALPRAEGMRC